MKKRIARKLKKEVKKYLADRFDVPIKEVNIRKNIGFTDLF